MSAGARGNLSLVTTDPMDAADQQDPTDPSNISQGPTGAPGQQSGPAVPNPLNRPTSQRSALYSSLITSIFRALREDETFECLVEKEKTGLELVHILVAIRYYELTGKLSKDEAEELIGKCEGCMLDAEIAKKRKHKVTRRDVHAARKAAEAIGKPSDKDPWKDWEQAAAQADNSYNLPPLEDLERELDAMPVITATDGGDWNQEPSRHGWSPEAFVEEKLEGTTVILKSNQFRRMILDVAALAIVLTAGVKLNSVINADSPKTTWIQTVATDQPEVAPLSLGSIVITIDPDAKATESDAESKPAPAKTAVAPKPNPPAPGTITVATAPRPTTVTAAPMAAQAQVHPIQPETAPQTSINLPIATKPGTYGGIALDEARSKKLWESAGWTVKARMGAGGKKVFVLSKNGRAFVTGDTKIAEGQTEITASLEQ